MLSGAIYCSYSMKIHEIAETLSGDKFSVQIPKGVFWVTKKFDIDINIFHENFSHLLPGYSQFTQTIDSALDD